jgi:DNA/RNA endonuclease YhcR with UshA esterase domain
MRRWVLFITLTWIQLSAAGLSAEQIIQWNEADKFYGQTVTVEGTIVATHNSGKACFLNFHQDYKRYFTAVIFASAFDQFPPSPETFYSGKTVQITGVVKEYKGKPEIILERPSQIKIVREPNEVRTINQVVSWEEAHLYYGKTVTVEGEVVAVYNSGKACFLNFHRNWKKYFTGVIFASDFHKFSPAPEIKYKDKKVRITGAVKEYQGKPEIIVDDPSQIEILNSYHVTFNVSYF